MFSQLLENCWNILMNFIVQNVGKILDRPLSPMMNFLKFSSSLYPLSNLIAPQQPSVQFSTQCYDYFLILDFEATCDKKRKFSPMEIIEFPVLKVNGRTFEIEETFHRYIRPTANPILTTFCTDLTGILQEMVDESDKFGKVFQDFQQWMKEVKLVNEKQAPISSFTFVTCGDWDFQRMLPVQCRLCGIQTPIYMRSWINIKQSFSDQLKHWPKSQKYLLEYFDITPVGRAHSGIDDCHNLYQIFRELGARGHVYHNTSHFKES